MTQTHGRTSCPICGGGLLKLAEWAPNRTHDHVLIDCGFCGTFIMKEEAIHAAVDQMQLPRPQKQTLPIAHQVRRLQAHRSREQGPPIVNLTTLHSWWHTARLPSPAEQLDNLVRLLGELGQDDPGAIQELDYGRHGAIMGAASEGAFDFVLRHAMNAGLVDHYISSIAMGDQRRLLPRLSMAGWRRYEELQRGDTSSRTAFMAMKFGDPTLDGILNTHFRPAVDATGFRLKRLDEQQPAGLIDDHLRVEIKRARFLIADLSHHNNGAYWEAGYAEGLGKAVIYTCEKSAFAQGTHFDTNHHLTVIWDPDEPDVAAQKLKDTIRATLPDARMDDEDV